MAEFFTTHPKHGIASQIADMLNRYNGWYTVFSANLIIMSPAYYFVEYNLDKVVGCCSLIKESTDLSKIQHICTLPEYRKLGIAKKLTNTALMACKTDCVYMTIKQDNISSQALAKSLGFRYVKKHWYRDHWTLTFGKVLGGYTSDRQSGYKN